MEISGQNPHREHFIFVCEKTRPDRKCCMPDGALLTEALKSKIDQLGLASKIRVVRTGCLDLCERGPNVLIEPSHQIFNRVQLSDVDSILGRIC